MEIGSFGDVIFMVSPDKTFTFNGMERSGSSRWNDHDIVQQKPISEFGGPSLDEVKFTVLLKAELGVNPIKELEKLRNMKDMGKVSFFIIGGKPISNNYWSLQNLSERYKAIDNRGNILVAEADLSLKEYVINKKKEKATISSMSTSSTNSQALGTMTITVKSVNIRSAPSTDGRVLGYAFNGDTLTVISESNGWYSLSQGKYITANSKYSTLKKG